MFKVFAFFLASAFTGINAQPLLPNWYLENSYIDFTRNPVMSKDLMDKISSRIAKAGYKSADITISKWEMPDNTDEKIEKSPYLKLIFDNQGREVLREYTIKWIRGENSYLALFNHNNQGLVESITSYERMADDLVNGSLDYFYENGKIVKLIQSNKSTGEIIKEYSFKYDELNRLTGITGDSNPIELKYDRPDPDGKLRTLLYNDLTFFNIMYKENGRVESFSYSGGSGMLTKTEELFYVGDETFPMELVSYRKGVAAVQGREYKYSYEYKYDEFGNLTEIRYTEEQPDEKGEVKSEKVTLYQFNYK